MRGISIGEVVSLSIQFFYFYESPLYKHKLRVGFYLRLFFELCLIPNIKELTCETEKSDIS